MKLSFLAAALVALSLTACDRPKQAVPASIEGYGTRTEEGTTLDETREGPTLDEQRSLSTSDAGQRVLTVPEEDVEHGASTEATADDDDEFSGQAVLPGHALDGNGNPIRAGQNVIPEGH